VALANTPEGADLARALRKRPFRHPGENLVMAALVLCAAVSIATTFAIVYILFADAIGFFREVSFWHFLNPMNEWQALIDPRTFGVWELVAGTVNVTLWSMVIALPLGLAAAIYLSEYAHVQTHRYLKPLLELLAGVPTVVYAYFALTFISDDILLPLFGDRISFFNSLAASLMLAVMILPTIASVSEDAMASVPRDLREAAYGLGATRLEVAFRVVFPAAISGIMAAVLLAIARVIGETMIVAVAAGSNPTLSLSPLETIQTMTGFMLQVAGGDAARGTTDYTSLFAVGALLFLMTLVLNVGAQVIVRRFREAYE
jgi:phosphate transport system permease protein